jgi:hypothetical protein
MWDRKRFSLYRVLGQPNLSYTCIILVLFFIYPLISPYNEKRPKGFPLSLSHTCIKQIQNTLTSYLLFAGTTIIPEHPDKSKDRMRKDPGFPLSLSRNEAKLDLSNIESSITIKV